MKVLVIISFITQNILFFPFQSGILFQESMKHFERAIGTFQRLAEIDSEVRESFVSIVFGSVFYHFLCFHAFTITRRI